MTGGYLSATTLMVDLTLVSKIENFASVGWRRSWPPPWRRSRRRPCRQNPGLGAPHNCTPWDIALCEGTSDTACCTQTRTDLNLTLPCRYLGRCRCQVGSLGGSLDSYAGTRCPSLSQRPCMQLLQYTPDCGPPGVADHSWLLRP